MFRSTKPLEGLQPKKAKAVSRTEIVSKYDTYIAELQEAVCYAVNTQHNIDCTVTVMEAFERIKPPYSTERYSAGGLFYRIFGSHPVTGTRVSVEDIIDLTSGDMTISRKTLAHWADGKIPYGKGSSAVVTYHPRNNDAPAYYLLETYTEKRYSA